MLLLSRSMLSIAVPRVAVGVAVLAPADTVIAAVAVLLLLLLMLLVGAAACWWYW